MTQSVQLEANAEFEDLPDDAPVYIEDFTEDDLVYFHRTIGIAINIEKQSLILFERVGREWYDQTLPLSNLRNATEINVEAAEYINQNQFGGARGIGHGVANAIRNATEQSKARRGTGIKLSFRSVERPSFLINITDETERARLMEALQQAISDGKMQTPYRVIPDGVCEAYRRPTKADLEKADAAARPVERRTAKTKISGREYLGILIFSACAVLPIFYAIREYGFRINGYYLKFHAFDAIIYFIMAAIGAWIGLLTFKALRFWIWDDRSA